MSPIPSIKLNTGNSIPAIGLGGAPKSRTPEAIADAQRWLLTGFEAGYRHFDVAYAYMTEASLGAAFRASGVPREEVFITTKLPWYHTKYVERSFNESLSNLGMDYVDLYLLHGPQSFNYPNGYDGPTTMQARLTEGTVDDSWTFNDTWAAVERLHESGRARAIGVSNFSVKTLEELLKTAKIVPAVNQVEIHPYHAQPALVKYCRAKGIALVAYTPSGREHVRTDPTLAALAAKYSVSPNQIILAWHLARGIVAIPGSTDAGRQRENITLPTLSGEDVESITALDRRERMVPKIEPGGTLLGWTVERLGWSC
ncbi:NADP-dependent oxidoreductase domain-containing protein [Mycena filopes]|nr:NADP-dependent oxidoreductase domain-containing protein [Mycena filopes]